MPDQINYPDTRVEWALPDGSKEWLIEVGLGRYNHGPGPDEVLDRVKACLAGDHAAALDKAQQNRAAVERNAVDLVEQAWESTKRHAATAAEAWVEVEKLKAELAVSKAREKELEEKLSVTHPPEQMEFGALTRRHNDGAAMDVESCGVGPYALKDAHELCARLWAQEKAEHEFTKYTFEIAQRVPAGRWHRP